MIDEITKAESFRSSCFTFSERIKDAKVWLSTRPQKAKEKKNRIICRCGVFQCTIRCNVQLRVNHPPYFGRDAMIVLRLDNSYIINIDSKMVGITMLLAYSTEDARIKPHRSK